ncbi:unnamed protein product [Allacma fusca]|uniref:Uncharacterized protein n=1 Tax=Allacma fusca TaxID=39272 RepID=A0A8J2K3B1_9HEXA|nr:unnamed protein product [Allacma fusca]
MSNPMELVRTPEGFTFTTPAEWPNWIRRFERFAMAAGMDPAEETKKINMMVYLMGDPADNIMASFR